jgi:nitrite reductase/ring-hydroxylating ferredoxin subunit/alkylhydroperoxidase/carboxymuconolactone decarboxylase family protein YurZ
MSDALNYLMKVRPGEMKSYFEFVKQAGGHLDPKTRAIISVITKVDNQTQAGLRQYLVRAMRVGVTADEIIDALFMAFPTLGLSKIIWAVDIILDMDLPEFDPQSLGQKAAWHDVIAIDELRDKEVTYVHTKDRDLFIYAANDELKVFDSRCPHHATNIPELALEDCKLTCPKHGWRFDVRNGECIEKGNRPLHELENRVVEGRLEGFW